MHQSMIFSETDPLSHYLKILIQFFPSTAMCCHAELRVLHSFCQRFLKILVEKFHDSTSHLNLLHTYLVLHSQQPHIIYLCHRHMHHHHLYAFTFSPKYADTFTVSFQCFAYFIRSTIEWIHRMNRIHRSTGGLKTYPT